MTSRTMRILSIITGALLIAAGIYCLCNQDVAAMSAGIVLGLLMLIAGIVEIVIFAGTSRFILGSGWLLLDGVLTVIMSLFLLFNHHTEQVWGIVLVYSSWVLSEPLIR